MTGTTDRTHTTPDTEIAALVREVTTQTSRLIRDELRLARAEVASKGKRAGTGAGLFGGAGVVALYGVGALLAAAVLGLATALPAWLAALIVGVLLLAVAGILALDARHRLRTSTPMAPTAAVQDIKTDVAEIKERASHDHG